MTASLNNESELLRRIATGDQHAFSELYHHYSTRILKKLIRLLKDEEAASELLQDIFLKVWERRETLDPEKSFRSYLFRIAENSVVDFFRRAARDRKLFEHLMTVSTELYLSTEETINFNEISQSLKQAIDDLPPQRRKVFILCKMEGKSYEQAAAELGISTGTVNDHMVKAIRSLKKHLLNDPLAVTGLVVLICSFIEN